MTLKKAYEEYWYNMKNNLNNSNCEINFCNKLKPYSKFKSSFEFEPYFKNVYIAIKQALTKFRISSHNLNIECGRYINIPVHERICQICENNVIEDEHVLINCKYYNNNIRNQLLMPLSESNIWELFNSKEVNTIKL